MFILTVLSSKNDVVKAVCLNKHSFAQDVSKGKLIQFSLYKEIFWGMQIQKELPSPLQAVPQAATDRAT